MEVNQDSSYEEIETYVGELMHIDPDNLDGESLRGTRIFTSLNRVYVVRSRKLAKLHTQLAKLEHSRRRHYSGKETAEHYKKDPLPEAILKTDIEKYLDVDDLIVEMRGQVKEEDRIVKFIEDAKDRLRWRGQDIKNSIEYRKMMLGM